MRRKAKLFIIYFPVLMVSSQVAVNLLYFFWYDGTFQLPNFGFVGHLFELVEIVP